MARIAGVNIPTNKRVPIALTYITGIGDTSAKQICEAVNIDASRRVNELSDAEVLAVREHIDANFTVEGENQIAVWTDHRLRAGRGGINNRQPTMPQNHLAIR